MEASTAASKPKNDSTPRSEFINGMKDTIPLIIGAIPFGIIFGAIGVTSGLSVWAVLGFSLIVFAGSAQFIAAGLVSQGVGIAFIILTTLIVNLRHALYAASLSPYVKHLSQKWLLPLGFWLTDETYAVVINHYAKRDNSPHKHWYQLGSSVAMYSNWQLSTIIGVVAGTQLEGIADLGLDVALVITFVGIVVPLVKTRPMLICALVAAATSVWATRVFAQGVTIIGFELPASISLMVASFAGIFAGIVAEAILGEEAKIKNEEVL